MIHESCERAYDAEVVGPVCESCKAAIGRMDYYGGAGDW